MGQIDWTAKDHCAGTGAVEYIHSVWLNRATGNELEPQVNGFEIKLHFIFFVKLKRNLHFLTWWDAIMLRSYLRRSSKSC